MTNYPSYLQPQEPPIRLILNLTQVVVNGYKNKFQGEYWARPCRIHWSKGMTLTTRERLEVGDSIFSSSFLMDSICSCYLLCPYWKEVDQNLSSIGGILSPTSGSASSSVLGWGPSEIIVICILLCCFSIPINTSTKQMVAVHLGSWSHQWDETGPKPETPTEHTRQPTRQSGIYISSPETQIPCNRSPFGRERAARGQ